MDRGYRGEAEMNLTDRKFKSVYFIETAFICLLSCAVVYCTLLLSSKINLFELSYKTSHLWRLNPYLTLPYLIAILSGMVITPLVWEKVIRRIDFKEVGFTIPCHFVREIIYGAVFFFLFAAYGYVLLSKQNGPSSLSFYIIISLSIRWLFVAFGEEVLYRGIVQRRLSALCGKYWGLILASVVFAFIGHPRAPLIDNLVLRLPFGLILGYLYLRSRSLLIPTGLHWGFNVLFAT